MADKKALSQLSTINRALGIIEGVMMAVDEKTALPLATAVEMIDETMKAVFEDGSKQQG
jgi:hypothetical protein